LAAWMPARRATASASPLAFSEASRARNAFGPSVTTARAAAVRTVARFAETVDHPRRPVRTQMRQPLIPEPLVLFRVLTLKKFRGRPRHPRGVLLRDQDRPSETSAPCSE